MNMAVAYRRTISLGKIRIPVSLYSVIQDNNIHFNQLHKDTKERIQNKKTCPHCDGEVKPEDIIKGFQFSKDRYVIITDEELNQCKMEKEKTIQISQFSDLSEIDSIYYDKPYYVVPDVGGEKAFELLRIWMMNGSKVAIASTILVSKETLAAFIPTETGMLMRTLYYIEDIKESPTYVKPQISSEELTAITQLNESMIKTFGHAHFHDKYRVSVQEKIDSKINAEEIVVANEEAPQLPLMEALRKSILDSNSKTRKPRKEKEMGMSEDTADTNAAPHDSKK
jgi:DNA end-binding protein Ku